MNAFLKQTIEDRIAAWKRTGSEEQKWHVDGLISGLFLADVITQEEYNELKRQIWGEAWKVYVRREETINAQN
jgi:hypothetical protein